MTIEQIRAKVKGSVWQAVAQSGVNLAAIPADQQNRLVDSITDAVLVTMNDVMDDVPQPQARPAVELEGEEKVLWEGRPFLSLVEFYTLTNDRLKIVKGFLSRDLENYELIRVQDIDVSQGLGERMMGLGDITIKGHDASDPKVVLRNIKNPHEVYETLRKAWLAARKRHGLVFREEM